VTDPLLSRPTDRRRLLTTALAAPMVLAASRVFAAGTAAADDAEARALDALYQAALAEGGKLIVYAGGDTPQQQDGTKAAFLKQFPKMAIDIVVDYSKFHDVRVDNQLATKTLVPDVVQLQTLQNFPRWKAEGHLLPFKPEGFAKVHPSFRDSDGAWIATSVIAFSTLIDVAAVGGGLASPKDLIDPQWRGKIASSYPHDDDAVLFLYKRYAETYGWDWIAKLAAQDVQFARGSHSPRLALTQHQRVIGVGGSGSLTAIDQPIRWQAPDGHPFLAWGQRAAIFKAGRNRSAAKLFMAWQISRARQVTSYNGWSVRTDVQPAGGLKPVWTDANAHVEAFPAFMADRALAERWRQTFAVYFGEVTGAPTPGVLGLHPGA
jgi:ABC-type Fe3+ transport system substrate-binding protein